MKSRTRSILSRNFSDLCIELINEVQEELKETFAKNSIQNSEIFDTLDDVGMNLDKIYEHGKRADGIVKSMLQHSRGNSERWSLMI